MEGIGILCDACDNAVLHLRNLLQSHAPERLVAKGNTPRHECLERQGHRRYQTLRSLRRCPQLAPPSVRIGICDEKGVGIGMEKTLEPPAANGTESTRIRAQSRWTSSFCDRGLGLFMVQVTSLLRGMMNERLQAWHNRARRLRTFRYRAVVS